MNRLMCSFLVFGIFPSLAAGQTNQQPAKPASEAQLQAEVHRLLLLSLQLQESVRKTQRFELSISVVQESAQIESLARALRTQRQPR